MEEEADTKHIQQVEGNNLDKDDSALASEAKQNLDIDTVNQNSSEPKHVKGEAVEKQEDEKVNVTYQ